MPVETSRVPALKNIATRLRIDSVRATTEAGSGHPDHVLLGGRYRGGAVLRRDALRPARPAAPGQRSLRAVEGPRGAAAVRRLGRGRNHPARGSADAAAVRLRISKAIRRRVCRWSTSPPARSGRDSAPASASPSTPAASAPTTAPTCCWAMAKSPKDRCGRRRPPASLRPRQPVRHHRRERPRPEPGDPARARPGQLRAALAGVRLAHRRHRRPRHGRDSRGAGRSARHQGPADDDRGAHAQGQGRQLHRRAAELARQGAEEGRRADTGDRRARGAAGRRRRRPRRRSRAPPAAPAPEPAPAPVAPPAYELGDQVATREAYGTAIAKLGAADRARRRARRRRQELHVQRASSSRSIPSASISASSPSR